MSLPIDWKDDWTIEIDTTDASDDMKIVFFEEDVKDLYNQIKDGFCAICLKSIPDVNDLCCECLNKIAGYHQFQHACLKAEVFQ